MVYLASRFARMSRESMDLLAFPFLGYKLGLIVFTYLLAYAKRYCN